MHSYLLEVDAWTGSGVETLRLATHTKSTTPTDTPASTVYKGRIADVGQFSRNLFSSGGTFGQASVNYGYVELSNADGALDPWLNYGFDGRAFVLRTLDNADALVSGAQIVFRGTVSGIDSSDAFRVLRLRIVDRLAELDVPIQSLRYAGTTTSAGNSAEGTADLKGQLKPIVFGSVFSAPGKVANAFNLIWQFSTRACASIIVYDGGVGLINDGDSADITALNAATI